MPYDGEYANKASHYDIVRNPEIAHFLSECDYLKTPSEEEGNVIRGMFQPVHIPEELELPRQVIAIDGSLHEASIDEHLPSTKVGYVKIGCMLIDMALLANLRVNGGRMVDPFRMAKLEQNHDSLTFSLPSANIRWKNNTSVREAFRSVVDYHLSHPKTRFNDKDPRTSLRTTLFHLAALREGDLATGTVNYLKIHKCPNPDCEHGPVVVQDIQTSQYCPECNVEVYPSDCLRLWEEVNEFQSNTAALTRFMSVIEHMLLVHYIRHLSEKSFSVLQSLAFFIDGPLALFGPPAWLHSPIMAYIQKVNMRLIQARKHPVVVIGLQKTGQVVDYFELIKRYTPENSLLTISDEYRFKYINVGREASSRGFGIGTYYGQDFVYTTSSGHSFVFALPYPFDAKFPSLQFQEQKAEIDRYPILNALSLIRHFETELYKNAVVPIALAHKHTAISLAPGGKVLDILTKNALGHK